MSTILGTSVPAQVRRQEQQDEKEENIVYPPTSSTSTSTSTSATVTPNENHIHHIYYPSSNHNGNPNPNPNPNPNSNSSSNSNLMSDNSKNMVGGRYSHQSSQNNHPFSFDLGSQGHINSDSHNYNPNDEIVHSEHIPIVGTNDFGGIGPGALSPGDDVVVAPKSKMNRYGHKEYVSPRAVHPPDTSNTLEATELSVKTSTSDRSSFTRPSPLFGSLPQPDYAGVLPSALLDQPSSVLFGGIDESMVDYFFGNAERSDNFPQNQNGGNGNVNFSSASSSLHISSPNSTQEDPFASPSSYFYLDNQLEDKSKNKNFGISLPLSSPASPFSLDSSTYVNSQNSRVSEAETGMWPLSPPPPLNSDDTVAASGQQQKFRWNQHVHESMPYEGMSFPKPDGRYPTSPPLARYSGESPQSQSSRGSSGRQFPSTSPAIITSQSLPSHMQYGGAQVMQSLNPALGQGVSQSLSPHIYTGGNGNRLTRSPRAPNSTPPPLSPSPTSSSSHEYSPTGEHPYGEHPSRTLFVRNINSNVDDEEIRHLFEPYGDIRNIFTQCKHRGFVMVSYYDIRHTKNAMKGQQGKILHKRKLDLHYSIPKDNPSEKEQNQGTLVVFNLDRTVTNEELEKIFGEYGEVKEIRETPNKKHHRFVEFYDVRDADKALKGLNNKAIKGKKIKIELSRPGGARQKMYQTPELFEQTDNRYGPTTVIGKPSLRWNSSMEVPNADNFGGPNRNQFIQESLTYSAVLSQPSKHQPTKQLNFGGMEYPSAYGGVQSPLLMQDDKQPSRYSSSLSPTLPLSPNLAESASLTGSNMGSNVIIGNSQMPIAHYEINQNIDDRELTAKFADSSISPHTEPLSPNFAGGEVGRGINFDGSNGRMMMPSSMQLYGHSLNSHIQISHPNQQEYSSNCHASSLGISSTSPHSPTDIIGQNASPRANKIHTRRHRSADDLEDRKQFELELGKILGDERLTLMIRNIPNKYSQKMLLSTIDKSHKGTYDFFYLPIDFKNKCNVGYAFINIIHQSYILPFYKEFHGKKWEKFNSEKVCQITYARIQGQMQLVEHFKNSSLMAEDKKVRPIILRNGDPQPFPIGSNLRARKNIGPRGT